MAGRRDDAANCPLCRFMRGVAFGGLGAALGGFGATWLGAELQTAMIAALFGTLIVGGVLNRRLGGGR